MLRRELLGIVTGVVALSRCRRERPAHQIRVTSVPYYSASGLYLAGERGHYSDMDLDVEMVESRFSSHSIPLLAGGEVDVAMVSLNPGMVNAVTKKRDLRIVAGCAVLDSSCGATGRIYGRKEVFPGGIGDPKVLAGKRVSIRRRSGLPGYLLELVLESAGMSSDDVELVFLSEPEGLAALVGGKIDAMLGFRLDRDLPALPDGIVSGISAAELHPGLQYGFLCFGPSMMEADRELGVRFLVAYLRGLRDFVAGQTPKFMLELMRARDADAVQVTEACRSDVALDGRIDTASVRRYLEWALRKGYCPQLPEIEQLIDGSFIEEARQRLGAN